MYRGGAHLLAACRVHHTWDSVQWQYVYQLHEDSPTSEELEEEEHITAAHHWLLPSGTVPSLL